MASTVSNLNEILRTELLRTECVTKWGLLSPHSFESLNHSVTTLGKGQSIVTVNLNQSSLK